MFNCSNAAWYGLDGDGPHIPNGSPGQLTLGTPTHYYHTLAAGVSVWNDTKPGTCSGEYICHASEIQTGWSPRSERPFQR
jgi:hypothetical protein